MLLYDAATLTPVDSFDTVQDVRDMSWWPTTDSLTYSTGQDIRWHAWEDGSDGPLATLGADPPRGLAWSLSGDRLAVTRGAGITEYVTIFDRDGNEVETLSGADYGVGIPVWSPDGSHLAVEITENTRQLIRITDPDGIEVLTLGHDDGAVISVNLVSGWELVLLRWNALRRRAGPSLPSQPGRNLRGPYQGGSGGSVDGRRHAFSVPLQRHHSNGIHCERSERAGRDR